MTKTWNTWSNISLQPLPLPVHFRTQVLSDRFSVNLCMCTVSVCVCVCVVLEVFFWSDSGRIRGLVEKSSICISNVTRSSRHLLKARGESTQIKGLTLRESPDHPAHGRLLLWTPWDASQPCAGTERSSHSVLSPSSSHAALPEVHSAAFPFIYRIVFSLSLFNATSRFSMYVGIYYTGLHVSIITEVKPIYIFVYLNAKKKLQK